MADDDFMQDPTWRQWADHVIKDVVPKMDESAIAVSLVPSKPESYTDIKWCVELGMMIMLNKPIIAVVAPGVQVPEKLVLVADEIVEADMNDPNFMSRLHEAMGRITDKLDG